MRSYTLWRDPGRPVIWNVDHPVGPMARNAPDDVKLVQFLLKNIYATQLPEGELRVTGAVDRATLAWIRQFQSDMSDDHAVSLDGTIDPVRNFSRWASISQTEYTIVLLNESYMSMVDAGTFARVPTDVRLEAEADAELPPTQSPAPSVFDVPLPFSGWQ